MPKSYTISMTAAGPIPALLNTHPGDKITWVNDLGAEVLLTYPRCVSPEGTHTTTIAAGSSGQRQSVNNGAGPFQYQYIDPDRKTPRNGTIDVS